MGPLGHLPGLLSLHGHPGGLGGVGTQLEEYMIRPDPEPKPNTTRVTWGCNPVLSGRGLLANLQKSLFCLIPGRNPRSPPALSVLLLRLLSWRDAESLNLALQTYISSLFNKTNYALLHICQFF